MKRVLVEVLAVFSLIAAVAYAPYASGLGSVQVVLIVGDWASDAPPLSLMVGVAEPGRGFGFVTITDDYNDGLIELPFVPVGSRLALGVDYGDGEVDCDIYDFICSACVPLPIVVPLLTNATTGESVGIDYGALMAPQRACTPGDRFTVQNGVLPEWSSLRFVDETGVPDLESFVLDVDTLPAINGDVVVSNARLSFTFVPKPSTF